MLSFTKNLLNILLLTFLMNAKELIKKYIEFFKKKDHAEIPSAPLIPEHDPTVLFTTAGMHPLVPYLLGQKHSKGKRLVSVQKCIRTGDIDEVGDSTHHTFFLMLGNWSLGDYFKKEAIEYSFEFLTKVLKINQSNLAVSVFKGDNDAPKDNEAANIWYNLGIKKTRVAFLPKKDNWWGPAGDNGPCGPDTEMFYWVGDVPAPPKFDPEDKRWVEIWNDVFMQYDKQKNKFSPLAVKNVDTGLGVERVASILQGYDDNYLSELFKPIIEEIEKLSKKQYKEDKKTMRIIADHIRAAVFILGDERSVTPGKVDQGYILRRFIRRVIRNAHKLNIKSSLCENLAEIVINIYSGLFPLLDKNKKFILSELNEEEDRFRLTLEKGLRELHKIVVKEKYINSKDAFLLFQSYGFPIEMIIEIAGEVNVKVDVEGFNLEFKKHQELSRVGAEKKFKGGLSDSSDKSKRLHTATHLLGEALRRVLGQEIVQKGSNITPERLRFDFNFPRKLTDEEKKKIEDIINEQISKKINVERLEMSFKEAKKKGAIAEFESKYDEIVSVYKVGDFSLEVCGGPHVKNTKEVGVFKIKKEESSSAGVRRIKAIVE